MKNRNIVVLHRGWVVVGEVSTDKKTKEVVIRDGAFVRRWGTSSGLGELAAKGPLENTRLDPVSEVRTHPLGVIMMIPCEEKSWSR